MRDYPLYGTSLSLRSPPKSSGKGKGKVEVPPSFEAFDKAKRFGYSHSMPTIFRKDGFEVMIYLNDHTPVHVHIFKAEAEVIINLGDEKTPPHVRENIE